MTKCGSEVKQEFRREKNLKTPLSAQLGIGETSLDALNEMDAEVDSESSSAPGETGGQSQGCELSVPRPVGSEAVTPAAAADAASGEGSLATGARDEGQAKAVIAQFAEPSVEAEKNSPAGKTVGDHEVGDLSVAVAFFEGAAVDPLREALAALDDGDFATAQGLFAAIGQKDFAEAIKDALAALDRKDYAAAQGLFEALGQKGAAAAQVKRSAPVSPVPLKPTASAGSPMASDSQNKARQNPVTSPFEVVPFAGAAYHPPLPQAEKAKPRRLRPLLLGTGLVLFAIFGVSAIYGSPLKRTFPTTKNQAIAGLSSAADVLKADLKAITGQNAREEERPAIRDSTALTQLTVRLDQIEHEYGARLDKLCERVDQDSSSRFADIATRLDRLEKIAALPATPATDFDVGARLDKLEKRVAAAAAPASEIAGLTTRLNKLEKKAADAGASSDVPSAVACRHFSIWRFPWPQPCAAKQIGGIY